MVKLYYEIILFYSSIYKYTLSFMQSPSRNNCRQFSKAIFSIHSALYLWHLIWNGIQFFANKVIASLRSVLRFGTVCFQFSVSHRVISGQRRFASFPLDPSDEAFMSFCELKSVTVQTLRVSSRRFCCTYKHKLTAFK